MSNIPSTRMPHAGEEPGAPASRYNRDGYLFPFRVLDAAEADGLWRRVQAFRIDRPDDARIAFSLNPHYLLPWLYDLARHPPILDRVETVLGPDI